MTSRTFLAIVAVRCKMLLQYRAAALAVGRSALAGPDREIADDDLEVADLARTNGRRCFHRLSKADFGA